MIQYFLFNKIAYKKKMSNLVKITLPQGVLQTILAQINQNMDEKYGKRINSLSLRFNILSAEMQKSKKQAFQIEQLMKMTSEQLVQKFEGQLRQHGNQIKTLSSTVEKHKKLFQEQESKNKIFRNTIDKNSIGINQQEAKQKKIFDEIKQYANKLNIQNIQISSHLSILNSLKNQLSTINCSTKINASHLTNLRDETQQITKKSADLQTKLQEFTIKMNKNESQINSKFDQVFTSLEQYKTFQGNQSTKISSQIEALRTYLQQHSPKIVEIQNTIKQYKKYIDQLYNCYDRLWYNVDLIPLALPIQKINWITSQSNKNLIQDNGKIIKVNLFKSMANFSSMVYYFLNINFSRSVTRKQCWAIAIKSMTNQILIGISSNPSKKKQNQNLRSSRNSFYGNMNNNQNKFDYSIKSNGYCYSASNVEFQDQQRSFTFKEGDTIYAEYDPVSWCLRFRKNQKDGRFKMPINPPAFSESYTPFVSLLNTDSVQLILPGKILS